MQTFLPLPDLRASARVLDNSRLGNQCYRETLTLLNGGWRNHPASKMWRGYEGGLCRYGLALVDEMEERGRWRPEVIDRWRSFYDTSLHGLTPDLPPWFGNPAFHASHRSNLLRKDPDWYSQWGWEEGPDLEYIWPC